MKPRISVVVDISTKNIIYNIGYNVIVNNDNMSIILGVSKICQWDLDSKINVFV